MPPTAFPGRARLAWTLTAAALAGSAVGCGATKPTMIATDPPGAKLLVDGKDIGTSPSNHVFEFDGDKPHEVTAVSPKPELFDAKLRVTPSTPGVSENLLKMTLAPNEAYAATRAMPDPDDGPNKPVTVQVDLSLKPVDAWQTLLAAATMRYRAPDRYNEDAGSIVSDWATSKPFPHPEKRTMTVRTRLVTAIAKRDPLVYTVRIESEVAYGTAPDQWAEYGRVFPEDVDLLASIKSQIGVRKAATP